MLLTYCVVTADSDRFSAREPTECGGAGVTSVNKQRGTTSC